jgi:hypothetical protein
MRVARIILGTILFVLVAELARSAGFETLETWGFGALATFLAYAMVFTADVERG